jgi:dTDP-4-amino-4,6-dideoxygalactose transaminase
MNIPFNKPFLTGKELQYIEDAVKTGKLSGNGKYTAMCHDFFAKKYKFPKTLLTTSCTDALEMAAILCNIHPGDEVIMPSYTFVSTANAFVLRGAKIVFADSRADHPNMDETLLESLITHKTKAIVPVHYAGVACNMDSIKQIARKYHLFIVEDAAQAIDSYYFGQPLGSIGDMGCFSFHETKNISSGEGGMIVVNNSDFNRRAEIIWEKGTNRAEFYRGEVNKYGWVDIGSSFLPSELTAAFLFAQLEHIDEIQKRRKTLWDNYYSNLLALEDKEYIKLPTFPEGTTNNGHMFYMICRSIGERTRLIDFLKSKGILSVFHYQSLHKSDFFVKHHDGRILKQSDRYTDCLLRLPLFFELSDSEQAMIIENINLFFKKL